MAKGCGSCSLSARQVRLMINAACEKMSKKFKSPERRLSQRKLIWCLNSSRRFFRTTFYFFRLKRLSKENPVPKRVTERRERKTLSLLMNIHYHKFMYATKRRRRAKVRRDTMQKRELIKKLSHCLNHVFIRNFRNVVDSSTISIVDTSIMRNFPFA